MKGAPSGLLALGVVCAAALAASIVGPSCGAPLAPQVVEVEKGGSGQQLVGGSAPLSRAKREAKKKKGNKQLEVECLAAHNKFRRLHRVPDLQWDNKLAAFAQKRSNHIAASDGAAFGHPPDLPYGENLYWHSSVETGCDFMVRGWYDEITLYNFKRPTFAAETGHFTQVVWRDTKRVGCAVATSSGKRGGIYLTCSYDPAGNFLGEFVDNVPRAGGLIGSSAWPPTTRQPTALPAATSPLPSATSEPLAPAQSTTSVATTVAGAASAAAVDPTTKPKSKKKKNKNKKKKNKKKKNKKKKDKNKKSNSAATTAASAASDATTLAPQQGR